jgi:Pectate lyase superfamily protein
VDDDVAARVAALEDQVIRLTAALHDTRASAAEPTDGVSAVSRRLLLGGGLAAVASGLAGTRPAGAQAATEASSVAFTPGGRLSSTNVQAALAELDAEKQPVATLDVRAAGAVGDGASDDTAAIQLALNIVALFGGGSVTIPSGTYRFTSRIVVPNGVDVWGCGGHQQGGSHTGAVLQAGGRDAQVVFNGVGGVSGNSASTATGSPIPTQLAAKVCSTSRTRSSASSLPCGCHARPRTAWWCVEHRTACSPSACSATALVTGWCSTPMP